MLVSTRSIIYIYLISSTMYIVWNTNWSGVPILIVSLQITYLFTSFFYVPQEPDKWKCCETETYGFSSLSEKTRKYNRLQMS